MYKLSKTVHKWASLFVGIQLLIWLATGLYFNLMDHEKATGNNNRQHVSQIGNHQDFVFKPIKSLGLPAPKALNLVWILGEPYYQLKYELPAHAEALQDQLVVHAVTGTSFQLTERDALKIAKQSFTGTVTEPIISFVQPPIDNLPKQKTAVWKVQLGDVDNTEVFVNAYTGEVVGHFNDDRRLRDLMFTLHFMDYNNQGSFNNWWIILFGAATFFLSISGLIWLVELVKSQQFKISFHKANKAVQLHYSDNSKTETLILKSNDTVLESLAIKGVFIPSSCGGGGTCGKCKFIANKDASIWPADRQQLSKEELEQGYRLSCQHNVSEFENITLAKQLNAKHIYLTLVSSEFVTPFIKELKFEPTSNAVLNYRAGAYMQFHIPASQYEATFDDVPEGYQSFWKGMASQTLQHDKIVRSYSIVNFDTETHQLTFAVRWQVPVNKIGEVGIGSSYLCSLSLGDTIEATGPFSEFYARPNSLNRRVFIGAGSGMAPLRAIIFEQFNKYDVSNPTLFIFGARTEKDLLYKDQFKKLESTNSSFNYVPVLSQPSSNWQGREGYVQDILEDYINQDDPLTDIEFYLCGPAAMMIEVENKLHLLGIDSVNIFKDDFSRNSK
ncbi:PepSY domain-containing protein [Psychrosphaera sp. B3R10]|uniref:PepSY domain-containing protein n=1 Tax=unclassified Psychrosphaera TaxID=2641570 RepID=UPI001C0950EA|nr:MULTISPECIES: PepSY domain-containing protein [unclassified Psychrosphaera]MBU2882251.1 PepSY domain-containing protein [Psychrosphaera sp. I2R16]MBU2988932.1 PepSY domain-containing protein [Psychrosphaera sp. B3R10]